MLILAALALVLVVMLAPLAPPRLSDWSISGQVQTEASYWSILGCVQTTSTAATPSPQQTLPSAIHTGSQKIFSRLVSETILSEITRGVIEVRLIA